MLCLLSIIITSVCPLFVDNVANNGGVEVVLGKYVMHVERAMDASLQRLATDEYSIGQVSTWPSGLRVAYELPQQIRTFLVRF